MLEISDLPNEILVKIFERVPPNDILTLTEVCPRWSAIIDEAVGIYKFIGSGTSLWGDEQFDSVTTLADYGVRYLAVSQLMETCSEVPAYKYDYAVREIWLDGYILSQSLKKLLHPLFNLRSLTIHVSALHGFCYQTEGIEFNFPRLATFSISQYAVGADEFHAHFNGAQIMENIISLLHWSKFPALSSASLHLPFVLAGEQTILSAVLHFILNHKWRLEKLLVSFEFSASIALRLPPLEQPLPVLPYSKADLAGIRLKKFFVHCTRRNREAMEVFNHILDAQRGTLQKLHFTTGFQPLPLAVIAKNWMSLVTLEMTVTTPPTGSIDLESLGTCTSLKILTLVGPNRMDAVDEHGNGNPMLDLVNLTEPELHNVRSLPISLESVRIFNLHVSSEDAHFIILELPSLKVVNLHGIGYFADLGVRLDTIAQMMVRKRIKYFSNICGFNNSSLVSTNENKIHSPFACLAGLLLKSIEPAGFVLYLDESGAYCSGAINQSPTADDHNVIIDHEVNVDFAIENDDLFENDDMEPPAIVDEDFGAQVALAQFEANDLHDAAMLAAAGENSDDGDEEDEEDESQYTSEEEEEQEEGEVVAEVNIGGGAVMVQGAAEMATSDDEEKEEEDAFDDTDGEDEDKKELDGDTSTPTNSASAASSD